MNQFENLGPELLALIEAYYDGSLPPEDARDFRRRLGADEPLAATVAEWEAVYRHGLRPDPAELAERDRLRESFAALETTLPPLSAARSGLPYRWLAVAATVLLLALAGWWVLQRSTPAEKLAKANFVWLPHDEQTLGEKEDRTRSGLDYYNEGEYAQAYPLLRGGVASGELDSINLVYAGISALAAGDPAAARTLLLEMLDPRRFPYIQDDVRYYLALAELRLGDPGAAAAYLRAITEPRREYAERVGPLLREIEALE